MEKNTIIQCGDDRFELWQVVGASINTELNSMHRCSETMTLSRDIETVLNKYWHEISQKLPKPHPDFVLTKQSVFSISGLDSVGESVVIWEYYYDTHNPGGACLGIDSIELSLKNQIMPIIKQLSQKKPQNHKKRGLVSTLTNIVIDPVKTIYYDDRQETPSEMQKELMDVYNQYISKTQDSNNKVLFVFLKTVEGIKKYRENECGFDIFEKEKEINNRVNTYLEEQEKNKNSNNRGEKNVEYAIKWFIASNKDRNIVSIANDCESKYRYNCILLRNADCIDEAQEYDHILVTPSGVVLIETKDWKGTISISADGKWTRTKEDGSEYGVSSPLMQLRRHEQVMTSILPSVPVFSVLCFSNSSAIINGKENFKYPVINIEQLEDMLVELCSQQKYTNEEIDNMVTIIESFKVKNNDFF